MTGGITPPRPPLNLLWWPPMIEIETGTLGARPLVTSFNVPKYATSAGSRSHPEVP
jgi:hypothetical protein